MVSAARSDALSNPSKVLRELFDAHEGSFDAFPPIVARHFDDLFEDDAAFAEIPTVAAALLAGEVRPLVRFRGMVQDTLSQVVYAPTLPDSRGSKKTLGAWGLLTEDASSEQDQAEDIDYSALRDMHPLWVVSPPGETSWLSEKSASSATGEVRSTLPHKFPLGNKEQMGVQVKIYDPATPSFRSTDLVSFVGILTLDSLSVPFIDEAFDKAAPTVPTLHALFVRKVPKTLLPFQYPISLPQPEKANTADGVPSYKDDVESLRNELIDWVAEQALCGDREAAEWVLMVAVSRVHSRHPEVLPPSLTITSFPPPIIPGPESPMPLPTLHAVLDLLVPLTVHLTLPANLHKWSTTTAPTSTAAPPAPPSQNTELRYEPHSQNEDLHSGVLQLPKGTLLTILEANVQEGRLPAGAAENLQALRNVLRMQTIQYRFPFSAGNGFEFHTDIPCIVLCDGGKSRKSVFLPETDVHLPLRVSPPSPNNTYDPYKDASRIALPSAEKLNAFRHLVCGAIGGQVKVNDTVAKYIQDDFVKERGSAPKTSQTITPDDLILRMNLVRLLALTHHEVEVSEATWDRVKVLDNRRRERLL